MPIILPDFFSLIISLILAFSIAKSIASRFRQTLQDHQVSTGTGRSIMDANNRPLTRHDIYHAAFLLQQKLPPELIPQILDHAEYWLRTTVFRDDPVEVTDIRIMSRVPQYICPGFAFLSTLPIGEQRDEEMNGIEVTGSHPVRKVVFQVQSQDQGWSSYPEDHGTDRGCWTWFEALVRDPDRPPYQDIVKAHIESASRDPVEVPTTGRELFRNLHALKEWRVYTKTWTWNDEDEEAKQWIQNLQRGQIIDLTAWARFVGWRNRVRSGRIDVYLAAVR